MKSIIILVCSLTQVMWSDETKIEFFGNLTLHINSYNLGTWWWQHHAMEMLFFRSDKEAGQSWWEDWWNQIESNPQRKPLQKTWDWFEGSPSSRTMILNIQGLQWCDINQSILISLNGLVKAHTWIQFEDLWKDLTIGAHSWSPSNLIELELYCNEK